MFGSRNRRIDLQELASVNEQKKPPMEAFGLVYNKLFKGSFPRIIIANIQNIKP